MHGERGGGGGLEPGELDANACLAAMFEAAGIGIALIDMQGRLFRCNPAFRILLARGADELHQKPFDDCAHPDDVAINRELFRELARGERDHYEVQQRYVSSTGETKWVRLTMSLVRTPRAIPHFAIGMVEDITESKRNEEALRESEERFRSLADSAPVLIWMSGPDKKGIYFNRSWLDFMGHTLEQELGDGWLDSVHPDDRESGLGPCTAAFMQRTRFRTMFRLRRADGEYRWMLDTGIPRFAPDGTFLGFIGSCVDLTAIKSAQDAHERERELLQTIIDRIPVMITMYEPDTRMVGLNTEFERVTGWSTADAAGLSIMEACYPDPEHRARVGQFMAACGGDWMDICMRTRDGRDIETAWANIRLSDSRQVGIGIDISNRKRIEQALQEADRRKDEFLAVLAHELRNPLAPLRTALDILHVTSDIGPGFRAILATMERQVNHLVRLVDDLLEAARITRGKIELRKENIDIAAAVQSAVEASRSLIDDAGQVLVVNLPAEPLMIRADRVRISQIVSNLLSNAARYTDRGGRIVLSVQRRHSEVLISVQDNGIGIPGDMVARIFDMFVQLDRSSGRSCAGLGIGLTLVQSLVQLHDGQIEVKSDGPGCGSEFIVRLPMLANTTPDMESENNRDEAAVHLEGSRILVVDDNTDAADSLALLLELLGSDVLVAYDGTSALELLERHAPDAIFLDLGMPVMDGYEVARRIRQSPDRAAVSLVAVSGWGQEEDLARTRAAGFDYHLVKPASVEAVTTILAKLGLRGTG